MKKMFSEKSDYNEVKEIVLSNIGCSMSFMNGEILEEGLISLSRLDKSNRFLNVVKYINHHISNKTKIVPIIICTSIILDKYRDKASKLSDKNIVRISDFSYLCNLNLLEKFMTVFNQDIFDLLDEKIDVEDRLDSYMFIVEDEYDRLDFYGNKDIHHDLGLFIKNMSENDYNQFAIEQESNIEKYIKTEGIKF